MKIINVYINCFIIEGAAKDASFFVNNIAFEYIQVSSQDNEIGFIPVPYNFIEDCINNGKIIEFTCVNKGKKSKKIEFNKAKLLNIYNSLDQKLLPEIFKNLLDTQSISNQLEYSYENSLLYFERNQNTYLNSIEKKYTNLKKNSSDIDKVILDDVEDKVFVVEAFDFLSSNFSFRPPDHFQISNYFFNFKVLYYVLRILEKTSLKDQLFRENIINIFYFVIEIINTHDDQIETSYFQKSYILLLKLAPNNYLRKLFLNEMVTRSLILVIDLPFVEKEIKKDLLVILREKFIPLSWQNNINTLYRLEQLLIKHPKNYRTKYLYNLFLQSKLSSLESSKYFKFLENPENYLRFSQNLPSQNLTQNQKLLGDNFKPKIKFSASSNSVCVCLYTCNKYLDTRVKKCFDSWFKFIKQEKYIFLGRGKDKLEHNNLGFSDSIIFLDCEDNYENLP